MALATLNDVQRVLDSVPPSGQGRIIIGSSGHISTVDATAILDAIEGQIIATLGFAPAISAFTKEIHAKLVGFHIWIHIIDQSQGGGDIPEYVHEWKKWADGMLESAKNGDISIAPEEDEDAVQLAAYSSLIRSVKDEPVGLTENNWMRLSCAPVVKKSETIRTAEHGGGTILVRGTDYLINWPQAEILMISGGAITTGDTVYVSYTHVERAPFEKAPDRVEYSDRGGAPNWNHLFNSDR